MPGDWQIALSPEEGRLLMQTLSVETEAALRAARPNVPGWLLTVSGVDVVVLPSTATFLPFRYAPCPRIAVNISSAYGS